ncbi:10324_t:CDS:2 [Ambispora gerdemannii]|uniref:Nucleoside diphosphate kinase n=1 Tax=Ambispora gerdemannii TaxID=144530 RepID=A0A9N9A553_9GLOM|nr:10324_t:CDS:2 [Ambispora gerdemannii]
MYSRRLLSYVSRIGRGSRAPGRFDNGKTFFSTTNRNAYPATINATSLSSSTYRKSAKFFVAACSVTAAVGTLAYCNAQANPLHAEETVSFAGRKGTESERTFIMVKPDGVTRGLVGEIISRFEKRGYKLVAIKSLVPSRQLAEQHYGDLRTRPFFKGLVNYITSGKAPVVAMVWEGRDVIRQSRAMIGATNPLEAVPGTIRHAFSISIGRNVIHGSDSFDSAEKEIGLWFGKPGDLVSWEPVNWNWIMAEN